MSRSHKPGQVIVQMPGNSCEMQVKCPGLPCLSKLARRASDDIRVQAGNKLNAWDDLAHEIFVGR